MNVRRTVELRGTMEKCRFSWMDALGSPAATATRGTLAQRLACAGAAFLTVTTLHAGTVTEILLRCFYR